MSIADEVINNPSYKFYKEAFEKMDTETLRQAVSDRSKLLGYMKNAVEQGQPEMINNNEYVESLTDEMQELAQIILKARTKQE